MIRAVRIRDLAADDRGQRYLVDRLWPRGVSRSSLQLTGWARDVAPSHALRRWFGHDPARWDEFRRRYALELDTHPDGWQPLIEAASQDDLLLLYAAKDPAHNNAVALHEYLQRQTFLL